MDGSIQRTWIQADLAEDNAATKIKAAVGNGVLDSLIYNAGIWESSAFSSRYDLEKVGPTETNRIIAVNMTAAITTIQTLLPNLRQSANPKIILIGSTSGLENNGGVEVAYTASKFGLRGVAHALRENLRAEAIGVACINPGTITTEIPYAAGIEAALRAAPGAIPVGDLVALVRCVIGLSRGSCVKEIDMPGMGDNGI
jgi:short-subunit dehydrogenase